MYPAAFEYHAPRSLDEALGLLAELGEDGRVLPAGQSLIPLMKLRLATPAALVDINRIPGLDGLERSNGHLRIGALVRHNDVVASDLVATTNPTMAAAAPWISDPLVRNLGTVCGSVAHADPQGDWGSVMLACGAEVVARSGRRRADHPDRRVRRRTVHQLPRTGRDGDRGAGAGATGPVGWHAISSSNARSATTRPSAVAIHLELDEDGRITAAGIALTSVAPTTSRRPRPRQLLVGETPERRAVRRGGRAGGRRRRSQGRREGLGRRTSVRSSGCTCGEDSARAAELARA